MTDNPYESPRTPDEPQVTYQKREVAWMTESGAILKDILTYAYRGSGKYLLITCVVLSVVGDLAGVLPLIGFVVSLMVSGFFCAIYFQLIQSTATGGSEAPEFPDLSDFLGDIIWPMVQVFVVSLISFGPGIAYALMSHQSGPHPLITLGLLGLGAIYFPMAVLAVVVLGTLGAASPHIVVPAIFRAGWLYWLGIGLLILLVAVGSVIGSAFSGSVILSALVTSIVGAYTAMTNARILGVIYRERQEELGWL